MFIWKLKGFAELKLKDKMFIVIQLLNKFWWIYLCLVGNYLNVIYLYAKKILEAMRKRFPAFRQVYKDKQTR